MPSSSTAFTPWPSPTTIFRTSEIHQGNLKFWLYEDFLYGGYPRLGHQYPEGKKRAKIQQPQSGPPGPPGKPVFKHSSHLFIVIFSERSAVGTSTQVLNQQLKDFKCVTTPCIVYSRIEDSGYSKQGCAYKHYDIWLHVPAIIQKALTSWELNDNVTIHRSPDNP